MITFELNDGTLCMIDEHDRDLIDTYRWYPQRSNGHVYAQAKDQTKTVLLHRLILARILNRSLERSDITDHINGDGMDNRRVNIRLATHRENMANRKRSKRNGLGFKGVYRSHKNSYRARITVNKQRIELGSYRTPEAAYQAYCDAAVFYNGEFANMG